MIDINNGLLTALANVQNEEESKPMLQWLFGNEGDMDSFLKFAKEMQNILLPLLDSARTESLTNVRKGMEQLKKVLVGEGISDDEFIAGLNNAKVGNLVEKGAQHSENRDWHND